MACVMTGGTVRCEGKLYVFATPDEALAFMKCLRRGTSVKDCSLRARPIDVLLVERSLEAAKDMS